MRPVVFLDRDGTVIRDEHYLGDPARVALIDGAAQAIAQLRARGVAVVIVTNQSGIARGSITRDQYDAVRERLDVLLDTAGTAVDATYMCPHHPDVGGPCDCRKPGLALYREAIDELGLDPKRAVLIGDKWSDVEAATALGAMGILVPSPETPPADITRAKVQAPSLGVAADMALQAIASPRRIAVFASGGGSNMAAIAEYLKATPADGQLALVASNRADAGALVRAAERGIATVFLESPGDAGTMLAILRERRIEVVALAGYLKHVPDAVTRAFRGRMLNVHPSLLPAFGGPGMYGERVHAAVLAAGAPGSGVTVHFVDADYDRGPIIAQAPVPVLSADTLRTLAERVLIVEHQLYPRVVAAVAAGRITLGADGRVLGSLPPALEIAPFAR